MITAYSALKQARYSEKRGHSCRDIQATSDRAAAAASGDREARDIPTSADPTT